MRDELVFFGTLCNQCLFSAYIILDHNGFGYDNLVGMNAMTDSSIPV
jgi:hypothetical protein